MQGHIGAEGPVTGESPGADRDLVAGQGRKRRERTGTVTVADAGTRRGAQGRATEAGEWWVGGDAYAGVALHRNRRWGAGETIGL